MYNILVRVHNDGLNVNAAKVELNDKDVLNIFQLSRIAGKNNTISDLWDYSPELGTTEINLEEYTLNKGYTLPYRNLNKLPKSESKLIAFTPEKDARIDCPQLYVNDTDFWWEGYFKHTNIKWDTSMIPLTFLKEKLNRKPKKQKSDLFQTPEQMNAIHKKIAAGMNHGLNAQEIVDTFNRHITKAQLVRVIMEHIDRETI